MREIKQSEDNLQKACVKWFKMQYPKISIHHSPNGGKRNAREALKFKLMGTKAGHPDMVVYRRNALYVGLAIELKVGKNTATDNQVEFMAELTANGWYCVIVYTMDVFIKEVKNYMLTA